MDKWLEYWQQEELHPDVFTDQNGNKHHAIKRFWQQALKTFSPGDSLLDIASGAGALYRCIDEIEHYDAHALDISTEALELLNNDLPSVTTHAQFLNENSFAGQTFDGVFSQFGIEYLADDGFFQVPRLLNKGGRCVFLSHIKDGVIDTITQHSLEGLKIVERIAFLEKAAVVAKAFKLDKKEAVELAINEFVSVEPELASYCVEVPKGHHIHLYNGVKQLLSNYNQYEHSVIINWLETASKQASENLERLNSMHNASLSESDIQRITDLFAHNGIRITKAAPFCLRQQDAPAAWEIIGVKQI